MSGPAPAAPTRLPARSTQLTVSPSSDVVLPHTNANFHHRGCCIASTDAPGNCREQRAQEWLSLRCIASALNSADYAKVWRKVWQPNRKYLLSVGRSGRI